MVQTVTRRKADPQLVLGLWNACKDLKDRKQPTSAEKIKNYMAKEYGTLYHAPISLEHITLHVITQSICF